MNGSRTTIVMLICATLAGLAACGQPPLPKDSPNVILILIDTLRADHLGFQGYDRPTSPALAALARRGVSFDRFYSHSALTRPSVASLFTARYPSAHGIVNQGREALPDDLPTIASAFQEAGYTTLAFVTNPQIHACLGFSRGFDRYEMLFEEDLRPAKLTPHDLVKLPATVALDEVRSSVESTAQPPFFVYVHLIDPHGPYTPPQDLLQKFADPDYDGAVTGSIEDFARIKVAGRKSGGDLEHFKALYDAEIASIDRAINDFVAWMDESNLTQRTHLIITADHGEEFMEHGSTGHGINLFDEAVRVPLIWTGPGIPQDRRVDLLAGIVDIFPTLVDLLRLPVKPGQLAGTSLRPAWEEPQLSAATWREAVFLEGPDRASVAADGRRTPNAARGVITNQGKIIAWGCGLQEASWQRLQVFDLDNDPEEQKGPTIDSASGAIPTEYQELANLLERFNQDSVQTARSRRPLRAHLPDQVVDKLRSLGYAE